MNVGKFNIDENSTGNIKGFLLGYPHLIIFEYQHAGGQLSANGKELPTYKAFVIENEAVIPVGAAWTKKARSGLSYYEVVFENLSPLYPQKIYARLHPSLTENGVCSLLWDTPEERSFKKTRRPSNEASMAVMAPAM